MMDVVYVVRPGDDNEELRYSLRSIAAHLPHGRVWIAGHRPAWVSDQVGYIEVSQHSSRFRNSTANLRAACEHPDVSEEFVYFNDDFFVIEDVTDVPVLHRGPLADVIAGTRSSLYRRGAQATQLMMQRRGLAEDEPLLSYEVHAPMVVAKQLMLQALDAGAGLPVLHKRTLYGNLHHIGGQQVVDVKVNALDEGLPDGPFVSTSDASFEAGQVGDTIRALFPEPCRYEQADNDGQEPEQPAGTAAGDPSAADTEAPTASDDDGQDEGQSPAPTDTAAAEEPGPPAVRAPKSEWVDYADHTEPGDHSGLTKAELIERFGG